MRSKTDVKIIGLTGQTGAGKTTVCKAFVDQGYEIINADAISRDVTNFDNDCRAELLEEFSSAIFHEDGTLNRKCLSELVFADADKLKSLTDITYPYITARILRAINDLSEQGADIILLDAPTLFESRADDFCELVICVTSGDELRLRRIMERDGLTLEQAKQRIAAQHDVSFYTSRSDYVINNDGDLDRLTTMAKEVSEKIWEYYHGN